MKHKYLEFGIINNNKKKKLRYVIKQDAYTLWHLAVRFKEKSLLIKQLYSKKKLNFVDVPRLNKFLFLYLILEISECKKILEIGSSSCEFIEGLEVMEKLFKKKTINNKIKFYGIDTDEYFNLIPEFISKSKNNNLKIYPSLASFLKNNKKLNKFILHDFGVSMYEFKSTKSFVKFLNKFDSVFIKVAFSKKKGHISNISGNKSYYFSIHETLKYLSNPAYFLFSADQKKWSSIDIKSNDFLNGYFYIGNNIDKFHKLVLECRKNKFLNSYFNKINLRILKAEKLLK